MYIHLLVYYLGCTCISTTINATCYCMPHATCYMLQNTISCLSLFLHMYKIIVSYWLYKHYKNGLKLNNDFSSCCISDA